MSFRDGSSGERDGVMVRVSRGVHWRLHEIRHGFHHCVQDGLLLLKELHLGEDREVVRHEGVIPEDVVRVVAVGVVRLQLRFREQGR